jgi:hypothetical protein
MEATTGNNNVRETTAVSSPPRGDNKLTAPRLAGTYRQLHSIVTAIDRVSKYFKFHSDRLKILDNVPRHDQFVDEATWREVGYDPWRQREVDCDPLLRDAMAGITQSLTLCLSELKKAQDAASGIFQGNLRGKTEGALSRRANEIDQMLVFFKQLQEEGESLPRQPYLIRQRRLSISLNYLRRELLEPVRTWRKSLDRQVLGSAFCERAIDQEAILLRVRATLGRLRDNPSQKMGRKLDECVKQLAGAHAGFLALEKEVQEKASALGWTLTPHCLQFNNEE